MTNIDVLIEVVVNALANQDGDWIVPDDVFDVVVNHVSEATGKTFEELRYGSDD